MIRTVPVGLLAFALVGCYEGLSGNGAYGDGSDTQDGTAGGAEDGTASDTSGGDDDGDGDSDPGFACDPELPPSTSAMRRLTRRQYENTLRDLTAAIVGDDEAAAILDDLAVKLAALPVDDYSDYVRLDQALDQEHVDGYYRVGRGLGEALTADDGRLTALAGACATDGDDTNDEQCVRDFVARFGRLAFRRPLGDDELDFYANDAAGDTTAVSPTSFAERTSVLLMVPDFVYLIEDDLPEVAPDLYPLSGYEIASRLSYHFWESMPDEALLQAAEDGMLEDEAGYAAELERVFEDPRTRRTLAGFTSEWLHLERLAPLDELLGSPAYDAFVGDTIPSAALRGDMIAEVQDLFVHFGHAQDGTLADLLLSNVSLTRSAELAAIYGVALPTGDDPLYLPEAERGGLLTRAALVATGSLVTHPVIKGKHIRTRILCDEIPPPPPDVPPPPQLDPNATIREQIEALTEREGTACVGCHTMLNPLGYVTENYDGLGRHRTEERVFDLTSGELLATRPVDTAAVVHVTGDDDRLAASGMELSEFIVESGRAEDCLARQYFRFTYGRVEDEDADGCALESLRDAAGEGGSLREMLREIATHPHFRLRHRGEGGGG